MALGIYWSGLRHGVRYINLDRKICRIDPRKMLFIAGSDDSHIPVSFQTQLADRVRGAEFWTVPGGRHNLERDAAPEEFDERVARFLEQVEQTKAGSDPLTPRFVRAA